MNLQLIDWIIFAALVAALNLMGYMSRKYIKGVADFLVAGRSVGRYLGMGSDSMMGLGAVSILAMWQMSYKSGFVGLWWYMLFPITGILIFLTGFGICRFRQTRAMTLGQFIEMRYSKRARIFSGIICYITGLINMGIFPAVGASFFVYYCGFPPELSFAGMQIPTILPIMVLLVGLAVIMCLWGGQVTCIVTDFIQSIFIDIMLVGIMIVIYRMFTWEQFAVAFQSAPNGDALLHPLHSEGASEFNKWFFLIYIYWQFYMVLAWAPNTNLVSSARDAHEAKMIRAMGEAKKLVFAGLGIGVLPLAVFVLMHHPDFSTQAAQINQSLENIANEQVRSQMLTPAALKYILPPGLLGALAGFVLFALISTHDTYLLAWGGILVQDVIIPLRGDKPLSPKRHMMWIRISVLVAAVFIILFSMFFKQVDNIYMYFDISGAIYAGAAGVILLAGLYWKRGTTKAAWATMITGAVLAISGLIYRSINPQFLNGRIIAFWISIICITTYVVVSLLGKKQYADLDEILNRKNPGESSTSGYQKKRKWFRWGSEVPKSDKILIPCIVTALLLFVAAFIGSWIYNLCYDVPTESWVKFWHIYLYCMFFAGTAFLTWIIIGGIRDLIRLFRSLKTQELNVRDDGSVEGHHAAG